MVFKKRYKNKKEFIIDPFTWFIVLAVVMVVVYLLIPVPQVNNNAEAASLNDFTFPTNSRSRAVPLLYGTVWLAGNNIFYCCLKSHQIQACS